MSIGPFLRNQDTPFWNRYTETMPRQQLDRLHLHRCVSEFDFRYNAQKINDTAHTQPSQH